MIVSGRFGDCIVMPKQSMCQTVAARNARQMQTFPMTDA